MKPEEAIRDVEFIKTLVAGTRRTGDLAAPWLFLWGGILVVGYLLPVFGVRGEAEWKAWVALDWAGAAASFLIGWRLKEPLTFIWKGIYWSWAVLLAAAIAVNAALLPALGSAVAFRAFWILFVGVAYLQAGYFAGREMGLLGGWLVLVGAAGLALPFPWHSVLYAIAGGGGFLAAAVLLRQGARRGG